MYEEGFEVGARAFTYTVAMKRLDWDRAFLGEELIAQVAAWRDQWRASLPSADEPPASPPVEVTTLPSSEAPTIPPPPPEVYCEQVIEDDPVVTIEKSDGSGDDVE